MISTRVSSEDTESASVKANTPDVGFVANISGQDEPSALIIWRFSALEAMVNCMFKWRPMSDVYDYKGFY